MVINGPISLLSANEEGFEYEDKIYCTITIDQLFSGDRI